MVGREVQGIEVELFGFDLGALSQLPTHRDEGVGDVFGQDRDRVPGAGGLPSRRQGDVDAFGDQHGRVALGTQHRQSFVVVALDLAACGVDALAGIGALLLGQSPQRLPGQRHP